jgi:CHAD domain-containing protein
VRRSRSILKLAGDVLPRDLAARFQPEFKWLGDLTTPVRDLDVYLLGLNRMAARLASADPSDLDPFRSFLAGIGLPNAAAWCAGCGRAASRS